MVKFLHRSIELIRQKLPLIAISLINVVMIASFEYLLVTLSIGVLLYIIIEILKKSEYENVAWILDLITHGLVIGWYVNMFTVGMPVWELLITWKLRKYKIRIIQFDHIIMARPNQTSIRVNDLFLSFIKNFIIKTIKKQWKKSIKTTGWLTYFKFLV